MTLWTQFVADVNNFHGLEWDFSPVANKVNFMDLTVTLHEGTFETTLFEKELNLYLYIPPSSCHPPGQITGLVFGMILRIYKLCSNAKDIKERIRVFYRRLLRRGYTKETLIPLFTKAYDNALSHMRRTPAEVKRLNDKKLIESHRRVFLHLPYHPNDPDSSKIQRLWREHVQRPANQRALNCCRNHEGAFIPIDKLTIAYSRAPNLGNMLSVRKFHKRRGAPVSSFLT